MLKAIIVDDEELSILRLKNILSVSGEIEICHTFLNPWEAYDYVKTNPIQLAFLDISMPEINGMKLSSLLHELDVSIDVIFVTGYDDYAVQAFDLSALDYLMKPVTEQRMSRTLDKILKKRLTAPAAIAMEIVRQDQEILTGQESRIVRLITAGLSNKEIANELNVSAETVKTHIKNVYRKLQVNNRVQALQRAKDLNIIA
ncbi:response regulator transcription factor [Paenibacillus alginolyticus]|uniref:response regulator transcription factor n=1 Tax=Paenibacillus alginolyticus TaxID=59839 RepID=UPI000418D622|nr:response regulator transcription factor [Paenibacillus alginolyticus]MCY9665698.1 response regulator transcription factor [Paenibacillus alginolyticus]